MKQHITVEQLNELSDLANKKLRLWVYKKTYEPPEVSNDESMLLSIGQMIEFLQTYKEDKRYKNKYPNYILFDQYDADCNDGDWWQIHPDTLCDDLWKAVKELLKK